jgi:hypothetical protein
MPAPQKLGLAAIVLFIISYFLPADDGVLGYGCFLACWEIMIKPEISGGWLYYSGFVFSNILFLVIGVALFLTQKAPRVRSVVALIVFLHVVLWSVLHNFSAVSQLWNQNSFTLKSLQSVSVYGLSSPATGDHIEIGYYVWAWAYGLLLTAHVIKSAKLRLEEPVCQVSA